MKTIHCIGDSHSNFFYGQDKIVYGHERNDSLIPYFKVYHLGPSLAYSLSSSGSTVQGREQVFNLLGNKIPKGSRVLFCFGEIDCRYHILKQSKEKNKDVQAVMETCINRYFKFIKEVKDKGYEVLIWGAIPSAHDSVQVDPELPRIGNCVERNRLTRNFNERLRELAANESIKFVSIFEQLVDKNSISKQDYYMDDIHLSQEAMPLAIKQFSHVLDDFDSIDFPVLNKIHLGGEIAKKGWKIVNTEAGPNVDIVANHTDLSAIESNSVDEIYTSQLQTFDYRGEAAAALREIYRVLKPLAIFRTSTPNLLTLCMMFTHKSMPPEGQYKIMEILFGSHAAKTNFNNMAFSMKFISHYINTVGFKSVRAVPEFKIFKEQSCYTPFDQEHNVMLNVEAIK